MASTFFRHCKLQRGNTHQTSWLPDEYARVGRTVKLREDGVWHDGWVVTEASDTRLEESQVPDWHKLVKSHRTATGDALPK